MLLPILKNNSPLRLFGVSLLLLLLSPVVAAAECVDGATPSYDDISAIKFERSGCRNNGLAHPPSDMHCSSYWMFAARWGDGGHVSEYSQFTLPGQIGTYRLDVPFDKLLSLLKEHSFFTLNPPEIVVTESADSVLSVKHCGVVTRLIVPSWNDFPHPNGAVQLYTALDALVFAAPKVRLSDKPREYQWTLEFQGQGVTP